MGDLLVPSWLKNLGSKALHALAPAAGAAAMTVVDAFMRGSVDVRTVAVGAAGAFFGYLVKKARPAPTP